MNTIDIDGLLIEKGNAEQRIKELEATLAACDAERTDLRNWFERRSVYGEVDPSVMTMRQMADHVYERVMAKMEATEAKLATVEARAAGMREAINIVLEAYSFISCGTREPVGISMKRPENELKVFQLVIALNNLRNKSEPTDCGTSLLAQLEEARWLLEQTPKWNTSTNWIERRDAWLSAHTPTGKEK